uniref:Putative secreted protein n=1 Tax=Anopheles darlingi TaxID=43151 RepID=A0A2M4DLV6_ANODA
MLRMFHLALLHPQFAPVPAQPMPCCQRISRGLTEISTKATFVAIPRNTSTKRFRSRIATPQHGLGGCRVVRLMLGRKKNPSDGKTHRYCGMESPFATRNNTTHQQCLSLADSFYDAAYASVAQKGRSWSAAQRKKQIVCKLQCYTLIRASLVCLTGGLALLLQNYQKLSC